MYEIALTREFDAIHYLVGGDWGEENESHEHHYKVEVVLSGPNLDRSGYLVDITSLDEAMDEVMNYVSGKTLNDLPEFGGLNPSIEHFASIWCQALRKNLKTDNLVALRVRIWEKEFAWASYTEQL